MEILHGLVVITFVHLLAAASPGPDFVLVTQQTLNHGKRIGLLCSLGIALGLSIHIVYSALGLSALQRNPVPPVRSAERGATTGASPMLAVTAAGRERNPLIPR